MKDKSKTTIEMTEYLNALKRRDIYGKVRYALVKGHADFICPTIQMYHMPSFQITPDILKADFPEVWEQRPRIIVTGEAVEEKAYKGCWWHRGDKARIAAMSKAIESVKSKINNFESLNKNQDEHK